MTMKVFIYFQGSCESFDVHPDQTAVALKKMVKDEFLLQLSDNKLIHQYLQLRYGGGVLHDSWTLSDIGITNGSTIQCVIKSKQRPVIYVFNTVTGETIPITGSESLLQISVAKLKSIVSCQSGMPVSTFKLSTPASVQLYDCNCLQDYTIEIGTILRMDIWDGWVEFLQGCLHGHRSTVQSHLAEQKPIMRFQLRVALYIAAWSGHLDLAGWLLESGLHSEEPVGVHPYRQWCQQAAHPDTKKCPIHAAAERNQLLILKLFITRNILSLICQDPWGRTPLKVAIQHGHRACSRYLANKLCSVVSLPNFSLSMHIYLQIKRWVTLGQKKVAYSQWQYIIHSFKGSQGNILLVDGFNQSEMTSKSRKSRGGVKAKSLQFLPPIKSSVSTLQSNKSGDFIEEQEKHSHGMKNRGGGLMKEDNSSCRGRLLPPFINKINIPRPAVFTGASSKPFDILNSSAHRCGTTPREIAFQCFTMASTFTEKAWLERLRIAQTLVRKQHSKA